MVCATQWYIDEPAAETVRYIFKLAVEGYGPNKIADKLREGKFVTPTEYYYSIEKKTANPRPIDPYSWDQTTVRNILDNRQYTGCAVNGKSSIVSYKVHKKIEYDESEWQIIPNMQEPIIDEETFNIVYQIRQDGVAIRRQEDRVCFRDWYSAVIAGRRCTTVLQRA